VERKREDPEGGRETEGGGGEKKKGGMEKETREGGNSWE